MEDSADKEDEVETSVADDELVRVVDCVVDTVLVSPPSVGQDVRLLGFTDDTERADVPQERVICPVGFSPK